jgi:hypothetical protein
MVLNPLAVEQLGDIPIVGDEFERSEDRALGYDAVNWESDSLQTGKCERLSAVGKVRVKPVKREQSCLQKNGRKALREEC